MRRNGERRFAGKDGMGAREKGHPRGRWDVLKARTNLFLAVGHKPTIEPYIYETKCSHLTVMRDTVILLSHFFQSIMDELL